MNTRELTPAEAAQTVKVDLAILVFEAAKALSVLSTISKQAESPEHRRMASVVCKRLSETLERVGGFNV